MAPRVGEEFDAIITFMSSTGFKARLADNGIEGLVDLQRSRSKFSFDRWTATLKSESASYVLEQRIRVKLEQVDLARREILLLPLEPEKTASGEEADSAVQ
jgi:ribonuclease R